MIKQVRKTPAQKKAFEAYRNAERQKDRYAWKYSLTPSASASMKPKLRRGLRRVQALGMGIEHGL